MTTKAVMYWYCYAEKCENQALFKLEVSNECFVTLCHKHSELWISTMGKKPVPLERNERCPFGWELIKQKGIVSGAQYRRKPRRQRYVP